MIEKLEEHRQLLKKIEPSLREIDTEQLLPHLNDCILDEEREEIIQVLFFSNMKIPDVQHVRSITTVEPLICTSGVMQQVI